MYCLFLALVVVFLVPSVVFARDGAIARDLAAEEPADEASVVPPVAAELPAPEPSARGASGAVSANPFGAEAEAETAFDPVDEPEAAEDNAPADSASDAAGEADAPGGDTPFAEQDPVGGAAVEEDVQPEFMDAAQLRAALTGNTIHGQTFQGIEFYQYFAADGRAIYKPEPGDVQQASWHIRQDGQVCLQWPTTTLPACFRVKAEMGKMRWFETGNVRHASVTVLRRGNATFVPLANDPAFRKPNYGLEAFAMFAHSMNMTLEIR